MTTLRVRAMTVGITVQTACDAHSQSRTCQTALIMDMDAHQELTLPEAREHLVTQVRAELDVLLAHEHECAIHAEMN